MANGSPINPPDQASATGAHLHEASWFKAGSSLDRSARTPLFHLQFYLELPFDVGLSHGAFNRIQLSDPPLEEWADFDLQGFLGMPELPRPEVRPCVVLRFRRVVTRPDQPFERVLRAYGDELAAVLAGGGQLQPPGISRTVVKAERIVPNVAGDFDERRLRMEFDVVLSALNTNLLAIGAAADNHRIRPVHAFELPPVILGWQRDLRYLGDPDRRPRLFLLYLHPGEEQVSSDHDGIVINNALAISDHIGHGPFAPAMEFLFAAQRSLESGRPGHAVLESGTAVELLVNGVVRGIGLERQWAETRIENVLEQTPFRNLYIDHFARALGVSVPAASGQLDPINEWLAVGYLLRNRIAHSGYRPADEEAANAIGQVHALIDSVADHAVRAPGLGIHFPDLASLIPHPQLDERSLASEANPSEERLRREAFREGVAAAKRGDTQQAVRHFEDASRHGSPGGAFNLGIARWTSGDLPGATDALQVGAQRGHAGAAAYLGLLRLSEGAKDEAEKLFRLVTPGAHPRGWPLAAYFLATILAEKGRRKEAANLYRDAAVVSNFVLGAEAAYRRGMLLRELEDPAAMDAWTFAVELGSPRAALLLADLYATDGDPDRALAMLRRGRSLVDDLTSAGVDIGYGLRLTLSDWTVPLIHAEIAMATIMTAESLNASGRADEAIALCDSIIEEYGVSSEPNLQSGLARALVSKSSYLGGQGRHSEALDVSVEVCARFGDEGDLDVQAQVTNAILNRAFALVKLERDEEALVAYDAALARLTGADSERVIDQKRALLGKIGVLRTLGRLEDCLESCDRAIATFGAPQTPADLVVVSRVLAEKANALGVLEQWEAAIGIYEDIDRLLADQAGSEIEQSLAWSGVNMGVALERTGRLEEAQATYDLVVERFQASDDESVLVQVGTSLIHKGNVLTQLGQTDEAIAMSDRVVELFDPDVGDQFSELVARALVNKAISLSDLGRDSEASAIYEDVIASFPTMDFQFARALVNWALSLDKLGRTSEAISACDNAVGPFANRPEVKLREAAAIALLNKGEIAGRAGHDSDALSAYQEMIERFCDETEPSLADKVEQARRELRSMQGRSDSPER